APRRGRPRPGSRLLPARPDAAAAELPRGGRPLPLRRRLPPAPPRPRRRRGRLLRRPDRRHARRAALRFLRCGGPPMLTGPNVILVLKVAVAAVTVLLLA